DIVYLLLGSIAITLNIIWAILIRNYIPTYVGTFYPFDFLFAIFLFSAYWFKRYFRYVHETEKLSKELIKADKNKDEFLANTSHELRTPIHGIINIAQTILDNQEKNNQVNKDLELLISIGRRMSLLINDLL